MRPLVTVLMATHNDAPFLCTAIESILNQTFSDFEFVIVNDASTDETPAILSHYNDPRIVRLDNPTKLGLAASLNRGLGVARGKYIARMDGDDISLPERLEKQVSFMEEYPGVGILGTQWHHIGPKGEILGRSEHPLTHGLILWTYLTRLAYPLTHPTVMMRRDLVISAGGYNTDYPREQDGELFLRLMGQTRYANLPEVLYLKRATRSGKAALDIFAIGFPLTLEIRKKSIERLLGREIRLEALQALIFPTPRRHRQHLGLQPSLAAVEEAIGLLIDIFHAMVEKGVLAPEEQAVAQGEIPGLIANMLRYCPDFAFQACDTMPMQMVIRYLSQRAGRRLRMKLPRIWGGTGG
jgi:hypothetical protein